MANARVVSEPQDRGRNAPGATPKDPDMVSRRVRAADSRMTEMKGRGWRPAKLDELVEGDAAGYQEGGDGLVHYRDSIVMLQPKQVLEDRDRERAQYAREVEGKINEPIDGEYIQQGEHYQRKGARRVNLG